jgi:hypothetical protein
MIKMKTPKPAKEISLGIGDPDIVDPMLWNYCALTSRLLFLWENPKIKLANKPYKFPDLEMYKRDMKEYIYGVQIRHLMADTPSNFNNMVQEYPVSHLNVCKFYGSEKVYRSVVAARTYVWGEANGLELSEDDKAVVYMIKEGV